MKPYIEINNANIVIFTAQINQITLDNNANAQIHLTNGDIVKTKLTAMQILAMINKT